MVRIVPDAAERDVRPTQRPGRNGGAATAPAANAVVATDRLTAVAGIAQVATAGV